MQQTEIDRLKEQMKAMAADESKKIAVEENKIDEEKKHEHDLEEDNSNLRRKVSRAMKREAIEDADPDVPSRPAWGNDERPKDDVLEDEDPFDTGSARPTGTEENDSITAASGGSATGTSGTGSADVESTGGTGAEVSSKKFLDVDVEDEDSF